MTIANTLGPASIPSPPLPSFLTLPTLCDRCQRTQEIQGAGAGHCLGEQERPTGDERDAQLPRAARQPVRRPNLQGGLSPADSGRGWTMGVWGY